MYICLCTSFFVHLNVHFFCLDQITGGPYKVVIYGGGGDEHIAHNEFAINPDDIIKPNGSRDKIDFTEHFVVFQTLGVSVSFVEPTFDISDVSPFSDI